MVFWALLSVAIEPAGAFAGEKQKLSDKSLEKTTAAGEDDKTTDVVDKTQSVKLQMQRGADPQQTSAPVPQPATNQGPLHVPPSAIVIVPR